MDNVSIPAAPQPPKSFAQKLVSSWSTVRAFAVKHQRPIFVIGVVLILGVVVAWSQFGVEISRFFAASQCSGAPGYSGSLSFSASKYSITTPGEEITLNWSGTGEACTLSGPDFSESQAELSGSRTVHPTQQTTYSVQCYSSVSPQGSCSDSITINVVAPKPSPKTEITITTKGQRYPTNHALTWNTTPGSSDVGADRFKCSGRATNASALDEGMADWVNHDFLGGSPNYVVYAKAKTDIWLFCWAEPSSLGIANWESNHITVEPVTITTTLQDVSGPSAGTARTLTWDTAPGTSALQAGTIYCEGVAGNPSALTNSSDWVGKRFLGGSQGYVVNLKMATSTTLNLFCYTDGSPKPPNWESNKITVGPIGGGAALSCSPASQTKGTGETVSFNAVGAVGPAHVEHREEVTIQAGARA